MSHARVGRLILEKEAAGRRAMRRLPLQATALQYPPELIFLEARSAQPTSEAPYLHDYQEFSRWHQHAHPGSELTVAATVDHLLALYGNESVITDRDEHSFILPAMADLKTTRRDEELLFHGLTLQSTSRRAAIEWDFMKIGIENVYQLRHGGTSHEAMAQLRDGGGIRDKGQ